MQNLTYQELVQQERQRALLDNKADDKAEFTKDEELAMGTTKPNRKGRRLSRDVIRTKWDAPDGASVIIAYGQAKGGRNTQWAIHCSEHKWFPQTFAAKKTAARMAAVHVNQQHQNQKGGA